MPRTFAYLSVALGLLAIAGCGEVKGGGASVADKDSATLEPLPPAPEDRNLKPTPEPLTPPPLPVAAPAASGGAEPSPSVPPANGPVPAGQPIVTGPVSGSAANLPASAPAVVAPSNAPPAKRPPANGGGGFLQGLFGNKPATAAPSAPPGIEAPKTPGGLMVKPDDPRFGNPVHISLSNASVLRSDAHHVRFKVDYAFTSGQPNPKYVYAVFLSNEDANAKGVAQRDKNYPGKLLAPKGTFDGEMEFSSRNPVFTIHVAELIPPGFKRNVSDVVQVGVGRDLGEQHSSHLRPAAVGVGAAGKGYGAGIVTTPVSAYFAAKEMIVFKIKLPKAMQMFKAFNDRNPKSQAEFDDKIIKEYGITLPELPAGERYVYDPAAGELMVEHPAK